MLVSLQDIDRWLEEDIGAGDLTALIVPAATQACATVTTREDMLMCGQPWFEAVFARIAPATKIDWQIQEGDWVTAGTRLCHLSGSARSLLTGERAALNLLQTLSGTATLAREYARAVRGTPVIVLDTRKTLPGLRKAQKYAVRCGGCQNHRMGLYDGILIKENHIMAAGSILAAVEQAHALGADVPVEVEVENLLELQQAIEAGADRVLLDNFSLELMRQAVAVNGGRLKLEVSGNVSLNNIGEVASTGIDYISIGALTKNVKAIDLSMRIDLVE